MPTAEELYRMLPQYQISDIIGHGGMGAVFKGRQFKLKRDVAIKILCEHAGQSEEDAMIVSRFKQEAWTMAKFDHPSIVSVFDFGETDDGHFYLVMEYVNGTDIHEYIELYGGMLPQEVALAVMAQVLDALAYAHGHGIVHRDIKPANILINLEGRVKVTDFGLLKRFDQSESTVVAETERYTMGTPYFMAPELLNTKEKELVDHRVDLYAVGVMLYKMLTGDMPQGCFKMPSELNADLDPRVDDIVDKAMQANPDHRYDSAAMIRADLDQIEEQLIAKFKPAKDSARLVGL
ncbi:MAG: serine/threonine protein kinase [Verrucomicrobiales bacterium]|nr:serine/threonine protein kinase [Verrucomicrobiales bacterium]